MTDANSRCCAARHCKTNEETLIDEEKARLFEFPTDPELRQKWESVCQIDDDKTPLLCELHFSQSCFDDEKQLRPDAVPAAPVIKRKLDSVSNDDGPCQKKAALDNQRPLLKVSYPCNAALNGSTPPPRKESSKNAFRLTISIDKVPKGEKLQKQNAQQNKPLCLTCNDTTPNLQDLYVHVMEHFTCDLCQEEFWLKKTLQKHMKLHENNGNKQFPFKCHKCDQAFVLEDDLRKHRHLEPLDDKPPTPRPVTYVCKKCKAQFKTKQDFTKHYAATHAENKVKETAK